MATVEHVPEGQLEAVVLADGDLRATFVPGAGMIGCSLRHRGDELLVQRGGLSAWRGTGRSFGLPLLHPWANRLRDWRYAAAGRAVTIDRALGVVRADANGLPIHGALHAAADWDVTEAGADADGARLAAALDYGHRDDRFAAFPYPHRVELAFRLAGDTLEIVTTVVPTGDEPVPIAFGWHPWLSLPGVERRDWESTCRRGRGSRSTTATCRPASARTRTPTARRSPTACSTTTSPSRRTRASGSAAAGARSPSSGAAATATRRSSRRRTSTSARSSR